MDDGTGDHAGAPPPPPAPLAHAGRGVVDVEEGDWWRCLAAAADGDDEEAKEAPLRRGV